MHFTHTCDRLGGAIAQSPTLESDVRKKIYATGRHSNAPFSDLCRLMNIEVTGKHDLGLTCHHIIVRKTEHVFRIGQSFSSIYLVVEGCGKVGYATEEGEVIAGFFVPGDIVGTDGVDSLRHTRVATAISDLLLLRVPYDTLLRYCHTYEDFHASLIRIFSREIHRTMQLTKVLSRFKTDQRLAFFLLGLALRTGMRGKAVKELQINVRSRDIALHLGMTYDTLGRNLKEMCDALIIDFDRNRIIIYDMEHLQYLCAPCFEELYISLNTNWQCRTQASTS